MSIFNQNQVYTPEQMQRLQAARQRMAKSRSRFNSLNTIAPPGLIETDQQGIPGVNDDPSFLSIAKDVGVGVVDLISRPNYAVAGLAEELFVHKSGIISALGRVGKELFSGVAGVAGEKETFRDVLDGLDWISEKTLGDQFSALDGVPLVGEFNARGTVGLALDIFLDPLTYLSGGGSALAKVPRMGKAGLKYIDEVVGGVRRVLPQLEGATQAFTKRKGGKALAQAEAAARGEIKAGTSEFARATRLQLSKEAHRQSIEIVQDELTKDFIEAGVTKGLSADLATDVTKKVDQIVSLGGKSKDLKAYLDKLHPRTALKVKKSLGLGVASAREEIGISIARKVAKAKDDILRAGLEGDSVLAPLAADLARMRAIDNVLELSKHTSGLVQDTKIAFDFGPFGRIPVGNWAARAVDSELGRRVVNAIGRTADLPVLAQAYTAAKIAKDKFDTVGRMLNARWDARKLRGYHILRRAHLDAVGGATAKNEAFLRSTKVAKWYQGVLLANKGNFKEIDKVFRTFAIALDTGDLTKLEGPAMEAALEFQQIMRGSVMADLRKGLIKAQRVRQHYFPHFIDAPEKVINRMIEARPGRSAVTEETIGRFAEQRSFNSILDIEAAAKLAGVDPKINFDPMLALRARTQASIDGAFAQDFYRAVVNEFGVAADAVPFNVTNGLGTPVANIGSPAFRIAERLIKKNIKLTKEQGHRVATKYGRDAMGEWMRQKLMGFTTHQQAVKFLAKFEEFHDMLPRLGVDRLAPDGSRMIAVPEQMGTPFKGAYIPASAAESIKRMSVRQARSPEVGALLDHYDNFNNGLKVYLTALFPAFHVRNSYSNIAQSFLDIGLAALNPVSHIRAAHLSYLISKQGRKVWSEAGEALGKYASMTAWKNADGSVVTMAEAAVELRRNNVVRGDYDIFEAAGKTIKGRPKKGEVPDIGRGRFALLSKAKGAGTHAGGVIEGEARIQLYTVLRQRGLSEREATERVNRLLFDYGELTEFERDYMKRVIPFWIWTKKNVFLQARTLAANPGRMANMQKLLRDTEDTPPLMDYEVAGNRIILDRNGKDVRMLTGIDLPIHSIDRIMPLGKIWSGDLKGAYRQIAAQMNPFFRVPQEVAAGESFFDSRTLDRQSSQTIGKFMDPDGITGKAIPQAMRRWLEYDKTSMPNGKSTYTFDGAKFYMMFKTWHISRFLSSSDAWFNRAKHETSFAMNVLALSTSLKEDTQLYEERELRVFNERLKQLEDAMVKKGLGGKLERFFPYKDTENFRHDRGER